MPFAWSLPHFGEYDPSAFILVGVVVVAAALWGLLKIGVVRFVLHLFSNLVRRGVQTGFDLWRRSLSWAAWPVFALIVVAILGLGWLVGEAWGWVGLLTGTVLLYMGVVTCLAYMSIDLERYEVGRGYKALHNPLKGQELAVNLVRYGHQAGVPLLLVASIAVVAGFALFNHGLYGTVGPDWYDADLKRAGPEPAAGDLTFVDFLAYPVINLLRIVDLMDLVSSYKVMESKYVHPTKWPASVLLAAFKLFFTLVFLQQIFASLRWGKLLAETIAEFWSPHEPIQERARGSLPQHGIAAVRPLLVSLRSIEFLTKGQRDQIPLILARIGPGAIPILVRHLDDPHESVRAIVAAALGHLHARGTLTALVRLRHDASDWVRQSLVEALGNLGDPSGRAVRKRRLACHPIRSSARLLARLLGRQRPVRRIDPVALTVDTLREALADPVVAVRTEAARALGLIGGAASAAAPELLGLLHDPEPAVRCQAAESLGRVGATVKPGVDALVGLLPDVSAAVRASAAKALGMLKKHAADAVPALLPLVQDRDEAVRQAAADALRQIGTLNGDDTTQLVEGLASPDTAVRADTAQALGEIGATAAQATPALVEALADPSDRVRGKAVEALGKMGEAAADAVPNLVRALRDKDSWVSALAAEALGEMGGSADLAIPALVRALQHLNPTVRANAAETLGKMGAAAAAASVALEKASHDEDSEVRTQAVRALGETGDPSALIGGAVLAALADEDPQVRAAAVEALGKSGPSAAEASGALLHALEDTNDQVQVQAAKALAKRGVADAVVIEALVRSLDDEGVWVQVSAATALADFGPAAAAAGPALLRVAQTGEASLREFAVRALILIQAPEMMPALAAGLVDGNGEIRKMASAGLIKAPAIPEDVVALLVDALRDPEAQVRANAANALSRLETLPPDAVAPLIECAADSHDGLRMNVAMALENAPPSAVADVFAHLVDDPNSRIRLIAASFLLVHDATHSRAAVVVGEALVDPVLRLRKAALELVASLGGRGVTWLDVLQQRARVEEDAALRQLLVELLANLEAVAATT
jgi:HEAT repeat protein